MNLLGELDAYRNFLSTEEGRSLMEQMERIAA